MGRRSKQAWESARRLFAAAVWLLGARVASMEIDWRRWRRAGLWILVLFVLSALITGLRGRSESVFAVALDLFARSAFLFPFFAWLGLGFLGLVRALKPLGRDA